MFGDIADIEISVGYQELACKSLFGRTSQVVSVALDDRRSWLLHSSAITRIANALSSKEWVNKFII